VPLVMPHAANEVCVDIAWQTCKHLESNQTHDVSLLESGSKPGCVDKGKLARNAHNTCQKTRFMTCRYESI